MNYWKCELSLLFTASTNFWSFDIYSSLKAPRLNISSAMPFFLNFFPNLTSYFSVSYTGLATNMIILYFSTLLIRVCFSASYAIWIDVEKWPSPLSLILLKATWNLPWLSVSVTSHLTLYMYQYIRKFEFITFFLHATLVHNDFLGFHWA